MRITSTVVTTLVFALALASPAGAQPGPAPKGGAVKGGAPQSGTSQSGTSQSGTAKSVANAAPKWDVTASLGPSTPLVYETTEGTWVNVDVSPDGRDVV
ncbi:MAG: hypothetical protein KJ061_13390, partial [Vicinamibacteraceae bacterium]|nr:hypothetical protein [Vicinamibacteraceae bacterium]